LSLACDHLRHLTALLVVLGKRTNARTTIQRNERGLQLAQITIHEEPDERTQEDHQSKEHKGHDERKRHISQWEYACLGQIFPNKPDISRPR
jgi:hypothetical protein